MPEATGLKPSTITPLHHALLKWYRASARDLPWRATRDPYRILVSEVMCQQTQVDRVVPFYERFLDQFPDERALAIASDQTIHRAWKGLGYPSRVERLRESCRIVVQRGAWPDTAETLRELPGIGPYTAAAVACFAFGRAEPLVDTNVARVLCRRFGVRADREALWALATQLIAPRAATATHIAWNNALMELGARICTARTPECAACPWRVGCPARRSAERLAITANPLRPVAAKKIYGHPPPPRSTPRLEVVIAAIEHDGRYLIARRPPGKPLAGKWEFPGGKLESGESAREAIAREVHEELDLEVLSARQILTYFHQYPDQWIRFTCFRIRVFDASRARPQASTAIEWIAPNAIDPARFPAGSAPLIQRLRELRPR